MTFWRSNLSKSGLALWQGEGESTRAIDRAGAVEMLINRAEGEARERRIESASCLNDLERKRDIADSRIGRCGRRWCAFLLVLRINFFSFRVPLWWFPLYER